MPLIVNGWTLLFHDQLIGQLTELAAARTRAIRADPVGYRSNTNVRILAAIAKLVCKVIPTNPGDTAYRIGNTMGAKYKHWSRAEFGQRFRLFFRYDSREKVIIFAWVNDQDTLRTRGARNGAYEVFKGMLARGNPPDDWKALVKAAKDLPADLADAIQPSKD